MKLTFPWLLSLLLCPLAQGAVCPTRQPKNEAAFVQVEHEWLRAVEHHDMTALGCILADEFEEADFAGSLIDRRAMLASAAKPSDGHYELADLHARVYGDFAYVRGKGVTNDSGVRIAKTRFTDIFVYREGRWQCVAGHESHFPEERWQLRSKREKPCGSESRDASLPPQGLFLPPASVL
jgi:ketosteroid isomerase-like protein